MRINFTFTLILLSFVINAQTIQTVDVLKVSDSIIQSNIKPDLFKFFEISNGSYYSYIKNHKEKIGKFLTKRKLKKEIKQIWVSYDFKYSEINGVRGSSWVKLDKNLNLIEPVDLKYIPTFILENSSSRFIPPKIAYQIALENFDKKGIKIEEPELFFEEKCECYVYIVINKLNEYKNSANKPAGNTQVIKVNAENGKIEEKFDGYYGLIIR